MPEWMAQVAKWRTESLGAVALIVAVAWAGLVTHLALFRVLGTMARRSPGAMLGAFIEHCAAVTAVASHPGAFSWRLSLCYPRTGPPPL